MKKNCERTELRGLSFESFSQGLAGKKVSKNPAIRERKCAKLLSIALSRCKMCPMIYGVRILHEILCAKIVLKSCHFRESFFHFKSPHKFLTGSGPEVDVNHVGKLHRFHLKIHLEIQSRVVSQLFLSRGSEHEQFQSEV